MQIHEILITGSILCFAGLAQSAAGFGYALFATPLLLLCGMELPQAITLVVTCSLCQALTGLHHLRAEVPWKSSFCATGIRLTGLAIGLLALKVLVQLDPDRVQLLVGIILCGIVFLQFIVRPKTHAATHPAWAGIAFLASGLLSGICGMGGPPLVLWSMAQPWNSRKVRAFLFGVFSCSLPVQLILLAITFGVEILRFASLGILLFPFVWLGSMMGLPIGNRIEKPQLQKIAYIILLIVSAGSIGSVLKP
ncbi:sulfite exporter TauE/SafE family protein [Kiritimatiellaeota bacterium B1221]|nr:sulfite exporter TauE/SafE family protein [Kiritimatiellaeota bacterium B1221]